MATLTRTKLRVVEHGKIRHAPEAASQSFQSNELVYKVAGKLTVVPTGGAIIAGVSIDAASTVTDTSLAYYEADDNLILEMNATGTSAIADEGKSFAASLSSNKWYVNQSSQMPAILDVKKCVADNRSAVGDTYGLYHVKINKNARQQEAGSACQTVLLSTQNAMTCSVNIPMDDDASEPMEGAKFFGKVNTGSNGACSITANGGTTYKVYKSSDGSTQITTQLVTGNIYLFTYNTTLDTAAGGFIVAGI